jgi:hypothetical protein
MLIVNDDHLMRAGVADLDQSCPYCSKAFAEYPLIMSDDRAQTVYHITCTLELATDLLVDLFTFFHPPAPSARLFALTALDGEIGFAAWGGCSAIGVRVPMGPPGILSIATRHKLMLPQIS